MRRVVENGGHRGDAEEGGRVVRVAGDAVGEEGEEV